MEAEAWNMCRRTVGLLMTVVLLGLAASACARVQSHFAEVNLVVYSHDVAVRLEKVFADDLVYARRIDPQTWRERGAVDRLLEVLSLPIRREL